MFFLNNETNRGGVIEKELKQFLEVVFIFFFNKTQFIFNTQVHKKGTVTVISCHDCLHVVIGFNIKSYSPSYIFSHQAISIKTLNN